MGVLRGICAVAWLVVTAVWELATALLGVRPTVPPALRLAAHALVEEYRAGRNRWVVAEVVDDPDLDVEP